MLKHEYEDRIGRKVTDAEYEEANGMYMACDEMDKDEFCREYKQVRGSKLLTQLGSEIYERSRQLEEQKLMTKECQSMLSDAADTLLRSVGAILAVDDDDKQALQYIAHQLEQEAVRILGRKEVVLRKSRERICLSVEDVEYIEHHLK